MVRYRPSVFTIERSDMVLIRLFEVKKQFITMASYLIDKIRYNTYPL
jgi:hypothetical protein